MASLEFYRRRYYQWKQKFYFVPTWADEEIFFVSTEEKKNLKGKVLAFSCEADVEAKWFLFVGRLQMQKEPLRLIDSFKKYKEKFSNSILIIVGDGNLLSKVIDYINIVGLNKSIKIIPHLEQKKLSEFYRACDVLLLTSNFEGMPRCVLESLGCGTPVVTTDVGEVRQVVKNGFSGEVVESFDPADIAKAIEQVLTHPEIYTKENCLEAVKDFTPQKVLAPVYDKIRELYNQKYGNG